MNRLAKGLYSRLPISVLFNIIKEERLHLYQEELDICMKMIEHHKHRSRFAIYKQELDLLQRHCELVASEEALGDTNPTSSDAFADDNLSSSKYNKKL